MKRAVLPKLGKEVAKAYQIIKPKTGMPDDELKNLLICIAMTPDIVFGKTLLERVPLTIRRNTI